MKRIDLLEKFANMKALADNQAGLAMEEVMDMDFVEAAKNGMLFLPLESEKLKKVYPRLLGINKIAFVKMILILKTGKLYKT